MSATVERHAYWTEPGQPEHVFYMVTCKPCKVALNSGHHYSEDGKHHAEALASEHNAAEHPPVKVTIGFTRSDRAQGYISYSDGYRPGADQDLVDLELPAELAGLSAETFAEAAFTASNVRGAFDADEAPDYLRTDADRAIFEALGKVGQPLRSLSIGDTVTVDGRTMACEPVGFTNVTATYTRPRAPQVGDVITLRIVGSKLAAPKLYDVTQVHDDGETRMIRIWPCDPADERDGQWIGADLIGSYIDGRAECGCPFRPAPEIRGDAADTLVEHLSGCTAEESDL